MIILNQIMETPLYFCQSRGSKTIWSLPINQYMARMSSGRIQGTWSNNSWTWFAWKRSAVWSTAVGPASSAIFQACVSSKLAHASITSVSLWAYWWPTDNSWRSELNPSWLSENVSSRVDDIYTIWGPGAFGWSLRPRFDLSGHYWNFPI